MPKENTHLWFASRLLYEIEDTETYMIISRNIKDYLLGSISPDTFFYEQKNNMEEISVYFHGESGFPTNETIISCIDKAKNERDIAFILGFTTHCALDIIWHPVIYYLTGNYYNPDKEKMLMSRYRHSLFETKLDIKIENNLRMNDILKGMSFDGLAFEDIILKKFDQPRQNLNKALKKQLILNMLFSNNMAHAFFSPLIKNNIIGPSNILGLFYREARKSPPELADSWGVKDVITGENRNVTITSLFHDAKKKAVTMINAAISYHTGIISIDDFKKAVPGEDLSTGKTGFYVKDIRFSLYD